MSPPKPVLEGESQVALRSVQTRSFETSDKEQALRKDVRTLGAMVGDLIREQGGEELFDFVETARLVLDQ